ncbi:hypothetical protein Tco_0581410, partial [Tanacetum coccineum]
NLENVNRDGSHDSVIGSGRPVHTAQECTYKEFLNCQPLNFKGTKGVVGFTQWFETMEFVFHINNYTVECQVKYATCTLVGSALTLWNSHVKTVGNNAAYGMPLRTSMKMITNKYCPRSEIKKLEIELWNQKVKADDKRRLDNNPGDNHDQQPPYKRQNLARAYTVGPKEKKVYAGTLPLCNKCNYYHNGPCAAKCANCKRVGHLTRDYKSPAAANNQRTPTYFECGNQGHYGMIARN